MTILFAAASSNDFNLASAYLPLDDTTASYSRPHCGRAIRLLGAVTSFWPVLTPATFPLTGTVMFYARLPNVNLGSLSANVGMFNTHDFMFCRTNGTGTISVVRRTSGGSIQTLGTFNVTDGATTLHEYIIQFSPNSVRVLLDGEVAFVATDLVALTGGTQFIPGFRGCSSPTVSSAGFVSEVTLHNTFEEVFFPCRPINFTESARVGFVGASTVLSVAGNMDLVSAPTLGDSIDFNLTTTAPALPAGSGALSNVFFSTRWGSNLAPKKLGVEFTGATPAASANFVTDGPIGLSMTSHATSTVPTKVKLTVSAT